MNARQRHRECARQPRFTTTLALFACALPSCATPAGEATLASVRVDASSSRSAGELDVTRPLDLDQIGRAAIARNLDLAAQRAALAVKDAAAVRAGLWPDPTLTASLVQPVANLSSPPETTGGGFGIDWDLGSLVSKGAEHNAALLDADAARLALQYQELVVAGDARIAAAKVASLSQQVELARQAQAAAQAFADSAQRARSSGDTTLDDVGVRAAAALEAEARALTLSGALDDARADLCRALGVAPSVRVLVSAPGAPPADTPDDVDQLSALARSQRADLVALERAYESHEETLRAAVLGELPRFGISVDGARDPGGFLTLGGGASLSLPIFDGNRGTVAVEQATREQLRAEFQARLFATRADIAKLVSAKARARLAQKALADRLPQLVAAEAAISAAASAHNVTAVAAVEVQAALRDAQLRMLALEEDEIEARLQLQTAVGAPRSLTASSPRAAAGGAP